MVLVNSKSSTRPIKADALAQANLDGGGNTEKRRAPRPICRPLPDMPADAELSLASKRVQQLESEAQRLLAQINPGSYTTDPKTMPVEQVLQTDHAKLADLPESRLEVARLEAQIAREWEAYQELPKRKFVGARTQSVVYAEYRRPVAAEASSAWAPPISRKKRASARMFGSVMVTVAIRADGTVERVEIDRSSGSPGPGCRGGAHRHAGWRRSSRSPPTCGKEADILHITRNWAFTRSDLLLTTELASARDRPLRRRRQPGGAQQVAADSRRVRAADRAGHRVRAACSRRSTASAPPSRLSRARAAEGSTSRLPFKLEAFELANERSASAHWMRQAVNTLKFEGDGDLRRQHRRRGPGRATSKAISAFPSRASACC